MLGLLDWECHAITSCLQGCSPRVLGNFPLYSVTSESQFEWLSLEQGQGNGEGA